MIALMSSAMDPPVFYDAVRHCWREAGHGSVYLESAIAQSVQYLLLYAGGSGSESKKISKHAKALGFGEKTGIDLPGERWGVVPPGPRWFAGETISVAIGQGPISGYSAAGSPCGQRYRHGWETGSLPTSCCVLKTTPPPPLRGPRKQLPSLPKTPVKFRAGMWASVNSNGTGHSAASSRPGHLREDGNRSR